MPEPDHRVFVYASLLSQREMDKQCRTARFLDIAQLADRRLAFTKPSTRWGGHSADVVVAPGHHVWGALYAMDESDVEALDLREGVPRFYRRTAVDVITSVGERHASVWVFEAQDHVRIAEAAPSETYWSTIVMGARERALPATYIDALEARIRTLPVVK
jgi:gamma-glutamylcyclotransferase (GGCT)/AIG2-like uncharacterized protein YtfP